ncbi:hypothetical protein AWV80_20480 [Cupriavidus sp. UYMU48A]|nr:hypothetical protein AWV80_20480 [Cupriavidus sp. UYMU48A]
MSQSTARRQPAEFDVVVVGSGAGGMLTACRAADRGLSVVVLEKSSQYGGTSAVSGGGIWIPLNHHIAPAGAKDDYATALEYLLACTGEHGDPQRLRAYLDHAPRMLQYLEQQAACATTRCRAMPTTSRSSRARCRATARSTRCRSTGHACAMNSSGCARRRRARWWLAAWR